MVYNFKPYDKKPIGDLHMVEQFAAVDLRVAAATGIVPGDASITEASYNGIENPASMLGKPDDVFAAYRMQGYIQSAGAEAPAVTPPGSEPTT